MSQIVSQLREEASIIANSKSAEIIGEASKRLTHTRFMRLRKCQAEPATPEEDSYVFHLREYVRLKRAVEFGERKLGYFPDGSYNRRMRDTHRAEMDRIEYNLAETIRGKISSSSPERAEYCISLGDAYTDSSSPNLVISSPKNFYFIQS